MSHGQTKFNAWLSQKDDMSINVGEWCKADKSVKCAYCSLCSKTFQINNSWLR